MENIHYVAVKVSSYDPENGFKEQGVPEKHGYHQ